MLPRLRPWQASPAAARRRSPPATTTTTTLLSRLRLTTAPTTPRRLLLESLALLLTSGLSSSHPTLSSRLLNSLLPHLLRHHVPPLLRLLPHDHLTLLLLLTSKPHPSLATTSSLHALALSSGHLPSDLRFANSLLSLYLSLDSPASARRLLADIPRADVVTWNTLLRACLRRRLLPAARRLFDEMPQRDVVSHNSMLAGYTAAGDMASARKLFDEMTERDVVTYNTMVSGYATAGDMGSASKLFDEMLARDVVTWNTMLAGYAASGDMGSAKKMFDGMPARDVVSWNSMVQAYAQAGDVAMARAMFDAMPRRSIVSWNVVLAMHARTKDWRECLRLFDAMVAEGGVTPNEKTLVSVLTACAHLGDFERGRWVHGLVREKWERLLVPDVLMLTALLTMYAKCGELKSAQEIFDSMTERSVPSWNSMIIGYGLHGQTEKALQLFLEMEKSGTKPNETTFVCVLSSCAHGGLVLEGWWCFDRMVRFYGINPNVEHFGCMMDLIGRAGLLRDSEHLVKNLQGRVSPALWGTLMSASRTQDNSKLGEFVGRKLIEMKPSEVGPYMLLSNVYAAEGRWGDVEKVREMMKENGLEKDVGLSLIGTSEFWTHVGEEEDGILARRSGLMLSEMGFHMKVSSSKGFNKREGSLLATTQ